MQYYFFFVERTKTYHRTNIFPYLVSLLVANVMQAIATIMNGRWLEKGAVYNGGFCTAQGALKNAANNGIALWSFMIAVHVFNLLFLRWRTTRVSMAATLVGGWSAVAMIVLVGPSVIQKSEKGPYFGVSGFWCWITSDYPDEQLYLEYFFVSGSVEIRSISTHRHPAGILISRALFPHVYACSASRPWQPHPDRG